MFSRDLGPASGTSFPPSTDTLEARLRSARGRQGPPGGPRRLAAALVTRAWHRLAVAQLLLALTSGCSDREFPSLGTPVALGYAYASHIAGIAGCPVNPNDRPWVWVANRAGGPASGVTVVFTVTSGGGSVTGGTQVTGSSGDARPTSWTLGATPGENTLVATSPSVPGQSLTFTATAVAGSC